MAGLLFLLGKEKLPTTNTLTVDFTPRSEEERIEEFLEENDALLKNQDKIPFKYISDIHYGKKTVWKNPDFEN